MAYVLLAVRWILALTLLSSGTSKVVAPSTFAESVRRYNVVPWQYGVPVAWAVIGTELLLGVAFCLGLLLPLCGVLAAGLFLCFATAIIWNLSHGRSFDCGCVAGERPISWRLATNDAVLAGLGLLVAIGPSGALGLWTTSPGASGLTASHTIPVPLIVITTVGLCRLAQQSGWLWPTRVLPGQSATPVALNVVYSGHVAPISGS